MVFLDDVCVLSNPDRISEVEGSVLQARRSTQRRVAGKTTRCRHKQGVTILGTHVGHPDFVEQLSERICKMEDLLGPGTVIAWQIATLQFSGGFGFAEC